MSTAGGGVVHAYVHTYAHLHIILHLPHMHTYVRMYFEYLHIKYKSKTSK